MQRGLTIALTGDVMLGRLVNDIIARTEFAYPWGDTLPDLRRADLRLINLECAITSRVEPWTGDPDKPFFFRSDPENVETLRTAGIDFAALANNHIRDFDVEGMLETIQLLDAAGTSNAGAGNDLDAAREAAHLSVNGYRIGVVAFADHPEEWAAAPDTPGLNLCRPDSRSESDFDPVAHAVRRAREASDLIVFTIHWGPNLRARPPESFQSFARSVIDAGADVFWGHSAHVVQGIEIYNGKPILYDTGDFVDDYVVHPDLRNDLSALFLLYAEPPEISAIELIPVHIHNTQVNHATGENREWFAARISRLCGELGTNVRDRGDRLTIELP